MGLFGSKKKTGAPFQFRVSDAVEVPLRGYLLRLKVGSGEPALEDLAAGKEIRLRSTNGSERTIKVRDISVTVGAPSQERLDRTHELDVVVDAADAIVDGEIANIGWTVSGPVKSQ